MNRRRASGNGVQGWRIAFLVLCTVGFLLSADLARMHVNVHTDPAYQSYCAISERINCDTVAASEYSVAFGLPLAVWGLIGYTAMGILAVRGLRTGLPTPSWPFGILHLATVFTLLVSVWLYYVSHSVIGSFCPVCLGTYSANLALFGISLRELNRVGKGPVRALKSEIRAMGAAPRPAVVFGAAVGAVVAVLVATVPPYWRVPVSTGPGGLAVGRTPDGHPWIGAPEPTVEIIEFSDYQCPHCQRGHTEVRGTVDTHADRIRLIHRNYPLDLACNSTMKRQLHPFACEYSRLAFCAGEQRRFWEANDFLFANGRRSQKVTAQDLASAIGVDPVELSACLESERARRGVERDVREGIDLGVRGTPTFVLDGRLHPGRIPEDVLSAALSRAGTR